jgi:hypothetical protein
VESSLKILVYGGTGSQADVLASAALKHRPAKYHDMTAVLEAFPVKMSTITDWVKAHQEAFVQ